MLRRRTFLAGSAGLLALGASARSWARNDPFALGVASGEPSADGFVIWTRLAPQPLDPDGGMRAVAVDVSWEIAEDEGFQRIVRQGKAPAERRWAHSVHVEVGGLAADRPYWYRFFIAEAASAVGRTRTLPAADANPSRLRFALASCSNYEQGFFVAYRDIATAAPDFVVHVGDYIYEYAKGGPVRGHAGGTARDLGDYRVRYAQYRTDPDLRAAHAACPWFVTWDDHEVENDYAGDQPGGSVFTESFRRRRAEAYQAYYEHMPLRARARPTVSGMILHHAVPIGRLASLTMLDTRQYRDDQACPSMLGRGGRVLDDAECAARADPKRSLLGMTQERWLDAQFAASSARWNVLGQQLLLAPMDQKPGAGTAWWSDAWDGYPAARQRLLQSMRDRKLANPILLSGDIHSWWVNEIAHDGRALATEFVGTSISSKGVDYRKFSAMLPENPHVKFFESRLRGYTEFEVTPQRLTVHLRAAEDVTRRDGAVRTLKSFVVEAGRPSVQPA
jgi:alkaline phosphatase D